MNRRQFLRASAIATAAALAPRRTLAQGNAGVPPAGEGRPDPRPIQNRNPKSQKPNILLIVADDINHWVGYIGRNKQTRTPNLDRFAQQAVSFNHAYCPAPVCNPARCAFMSGLHPSTTGVYGNGVRWNSIVDEKKCLNGFLKANGYHTMGAGKVYHISGNPDLHTEGSQWDKYVVSFLGGANEDAGDSEGGGDAAPAAAKTAESAPTKRGKGGGNKKSKMTAPGTQQNPGSNTDGYIKLGGMDIGSPDIPDSATEDNKTARWGAEQLQQTYDKPFFMALGMHKPHTPMIVPKKYFDLFPLETIELPPHIMNDADDLPAYSKKWTNTAPWRGVYGKGDAEGIKRWKQVIQAYLACVNYMDTQIGIVLDALAKSPHADNTIVLFLGDHGWHFGEKQRFYKFTLWEESARVPFMWRVPGLTPAEGATSARTVETLSVFPTLCDLAGLPKPAYLQGASIKSLLENPQAEWTRPALTTFNYMNHTLRTEKWRYIRYEDGSEELYDEPADQYEWRNLAADPKYAAVKKDLAKWLPKENVNRHRK